MTDPTDHRPRQGRTLLVSKAAALVAALALIAAACGDDGVPLQAGSGDAPAVIPAPEPLEPVEAPEIVPATDVAVALTPVFEVTQPIAMATHPTTGRVFIAVKTGQVAEVDLAAGEILGTPIIDIGSGLASDFIEQGLLGMAFSPDGEFLYLNFTDKSGGATVIAEYAAAGGAVDAESGRSVLRVDQPAANHNGGHLAFGPDGLLYIALGDGGGSNDEFGHGQNPDTMLGTIARIDPRAQDGADYAVPADNAFVDSSGAPETFIWGARNPWRFSFDRLTGDLWIADVGQDNLEEVNVLYANTTTPGTNLGWPDVEGNAPFAAAGPPTDNYTAPIYTYGRTDGCSVTGGYVYRGTNIPQLQGHYIFGDYCTSDIWALATSADDGLIGDRIDLGVSLSSDGLVSFWEDADGELYVLGFDNVLYRLDPA